MRGADGEGRGRGVGYSARGRPYVQQATQGRQCRPRHRNNQKTDIKRKEKLKRGVTSTLTCMRAPVSTAGRDDSPYRVERS